MEPQVKRGLHTTARNLSRCLPTWIQSTPFHPTSLKCILVLSSHLRCTHLSPRPAHLSFLLLLHELTPNSRANSLTTIPTELHWYWLLAYPTHEHENGGCAGPLVPWRFMQKHRKFVAFAISEGRQKQQYGDRAIYLQTICVIFAVFRNRTCALCTKFYEHPSTRANVQFGTRLCCLGRKLETESQCWVSKCKLNTAYNCRELLQSWGKRERNVGCKTSKANSKICGY